MIDFSVIIATYNRAEFLKECLNSLVQQTYKNFETIIVDDGSTDNTKDVIDEFKSLLMVNYIKTSNSGYPSIPRNIGVRHASASWLCFLDSDDKWERTKLKKCIAYINDYDVIYHKLKYFGKGKPFYRTTIPSRQVNNSVFVDLMTNGNSIPLSGSMVKKQLFFQVNSFDENRAIAGIEDYDLWLKISRITNKFIFIPEILGFYRIHASSITQFSQKQIDKITFIYERYLPLLETQYHKQADIIKDYYLAIVYYRMKDYKQAIELYKKSFNADASKQKIKALMRIFLTRLKQIFFAALF
jgi:glycosyltransferase involved in cell wall biosynthesis